MAVQRRVNWISQQRVDCNDVRSVESAASNDFDQLIQAFVTGPTQSYFLRGFNILMSGAIGGASSSLQLSVDPGAILHIASSVSGTVLMVPAGTLPQQLNSATNTIVDGAFAPSATNYVSIEYERFIDDTTSAQVYIWDPTSNSETTKNAPRAQILRFRIKITTTSPPANYLPIAVVVTDSGNNVVSITDARWDLFRLGRGGPTPNPFYAYPWAQGRSENPSTSTSNAVDPFSGGDKVIDTLKSWMDAVMTSIQEIKGTTYWYSAGVSGGSLETLKEDLGNTVITGRGHIAHGVATTDKTTPTAAGQINWDQDINLRVIGSSLTYRLLANPSTGPGNGTDITLADDEVAYITLIRGVVVTPNLIFTNGSPTVTSVGAVAWTAPLIAGDFVKLGTDSDAGYYQILTVDSASQVTLTQNYAGVSTGPSGAKGKYAFGTYQTSPTPSTTRHIFIAPRESVPAGQDVFWLFMRTDNGGAQPKVYIRFLGAELDMGEDRDISDTTSAELLLYIGSPSETDYRPLYVAAMDPGSVPQITNITIGNAASITSSQFFLINSSGDYREWYVWFKKDGIGTDPTPANTDAGIEVDITTGQTATQVASALALALNNSTPNDFFATSGVGTVQVTNTSAGTSVSAVNFNVGAPFAIAIGQAGTGTGNFTIKDGDNLTLAIKELDLAIGTISEALDSPNYDENVDIVASGATPPTSLNGPIISGTLITLPNNTRFGSLPQKYTVGKGYLEVFLNGQYLRLGVDWLEVGVSGSQSTQINIQRTLVVGDQLEFRIDISGGGGMGGTMGPPGPPGIQGVAGHDAAGGPVAISTKTSNYTVLLGDNVLLANATGGAITFTLPPAATATGRVLYLKKIDSSANAMTIQANAAELIDGLNTQSTTVQWQEYTLVTDGVAWYIL